MSDAVDTEAEAAPEATTAKWTIDKLRSNLEVDEQHLSDVEAGEMASKERFDCPAGVFGRLFA